ncbi:MAG: nucleotidyltransferase domain-containing protein [Clostridia bacterium]|nr:nucleotidyltransferase domain-containing protein [Clostridia bacterium]
MGNHATVQDISALLAPVFEQYKIRHAILFGSFAKGSANDQSDVDLLVDSGLKGLRFVGFAEELRRVAERPVDIFDVTHIESGSKIEREIQKTGITIYAR